MWRSAKRRCSLSQMTPGIILFYEREQVDMQKGPLLNNNSRNFTTRDSLGIESVAASISREICPIVNTVTPRAFYWAFMVWIYYDFYKFSGIEEHTVDAFDKTYLKRQDYFFVLSQLLNNAEDQVNLVGKQNSEYDINNNPKGPYAYNPDYFVSRYGGMQYYNAGCITLDYIRDVDVDNSYKRYNFPKLTKAGEKLAIAFQKNIKDTRYYKEYRLKDIPVPRDVLIEYGKAINLSLNGFDDCKEDLAEHLFNIITPNNEKLDDSAEYVKFIHESYDMDGATLDSYRDILFDAYSLRGRNEEIDSKLRGISNSWEIVIGRQYFTSGLECIWKYMLYQIGVPLTKKEWIRQSISNSEWSVDLKDNLSTIINECNYDFDTREQMIYDAAHYYNAGSMVENGLRIVLSMYNRFKGRDDFGEEAAYLTWGMESDSISFIELIDKVDEYRDKPIQDFIIYVMDEWLIEQHYRTAFEKMLQGRDGFYYEIIDGYYSEKHGFDIDFQGIRLYQLAQVMTDLDLL